MSLVHTRSRSRRGQTSSETILVVVGVAIACLLVVTFYGQKISRLFTASSTTLDGGKPVNPAKSDLDSASAPSVGLDHANPAVVPGAGGGSSGGGNSPGAGSGSSGGGGGTGGSSPASGGGSGGSAGSGGGGTGGGSAASGGSGLPVSVPLVNTGGGAGGSGGAGGGGGSGGGGGGGGGGGTGSGTAADGAPPAAPASVMGTTDYYRWRYDDYVRRHPNGPPPPDYYLDYGEKYAKRFSNELRPKLSDKGKAWLDRARLNLQQAIERERARDPEAFAELEEDADAFRKFAYDTHADAYWNAGLADLPISDLARIGLTPDIKDLFTKAGLGQVADIAGRLAAEYARRTGRAISDLADGAVEKGKEVYDSVTREIADRWRRIFK